MIKALVLVPIQDNEGQPFGPNDWDELERKFINSFGGFSGGGLVQGAWADQGTIYRDTSRRYEVAVTSWTEIPNFLALAHWTRTHFRQLAVYVEIAGISEIIGE